MAEKLLRFKDLYVVEYRPGEDELTNYRAMKRKRQMYEDIDEAIKNAVKQKRKALLLLVKVKNGTRFVALELK